MEKEEKEAFAAYLQERRKLHPRDEKVKWCLVQYWKGLQMVEETEGRPGEREALEAWLERIKKKAHALLEELQPEALGDPPLSEMGRLFGQTFVGGLMTRPRPDQREKDWPSFTLGNEVGGLFVSVLMDLEKNPKVPTTTHKYLEIQKGRVELDVDPRDFFGLPAEGEGGLIIETYTSKRKRGGNAGNRSTQPFPVLCARLAGLLLKEGPPHGYAKDLHSLLRYWKIKHEGVNPAPEGKTEKEIWAHLRNIVKRGRDILEKAGIEILEMKLIFPPGKEAY